MYCIYKIVNKIDGKIYIGRTKDFRRRMIEHRCYYKREDKTNNSPLYIAMRQYGIENFEEEIIKTFETEEEVNKAEVYYIDLFRKKYGVDNIYNYQKGGVGGQSHDVKGVNNPMYNKKVPLERRISISKKLKGRKKPKGFGEKISKALKGKKKSSEYLLKVSHPITVININTNEIRHFNSKAEMERQLHCMTSTIVNGGTTKCGWKLFK